MKSLPCLILLLLLPAVLGAELAGIGLSPGCNLPDCSPATITNLTEGYATTFRIYNYDPEPKHFAISAEGDFANLTTVSPTQVTLQQFTKTSCDTSPGCQEINVFVNTSSLDPLTQNGTHQLFLVASAEDPTSGGFLKLNQVLKGRIELRIPDAPQALTFLVFVKKIGALLLKSIITLALLAILIVFIRTGKGYVWKRITTETRGKWVLFNTRRSFLKKTITACWFVDKLEGSSVKLVQSLPPNWQQHKKMHVPQQVTIKKHTTVDKLIEEFFKTPSYATSIGAYTLVWITCEVPPQARITCTAQLPKSDDRTKPLAGKAYSLPAATPVEYGKNKKTIPLTDIEAAKNYVAQLQKDVHDNHVAGAKLQALRTVYELLLADATRQEQEREAQKVQAMREQLKAAEKKLKKKK